MVRGKTLSQTERAPNVRTVQSEPELKASQGQIFKRLAVILNHQGKVRRFW